MAENDTRLETLEDEVKVLKGEVKRTLVDLRALLMREDSPLAEGGFARRAPAPEPPAPKKEVTEVVSEVVAPAPEFSWNWLHPHPLNYWGRGNHFASGGCAGTWPGCSPRSAAGCAGTWPGRSPRGSACSTRISPRPGAGSHSRCLPGSGGCSGCRYAAPGLPGSRSWTGAGARRFSRQPSNPSPSGPRTRPGRAGRARAEDGGSGTAYSGARASHGPAGTGHGGIKP